MPGTMLTPYSGVKGNDGMDRVSRCRTFYPSQHYTYHNNIIIVPAFTHFAKKNTSYLIIILTYSSRRVNSSH